MEGLCYNTSNVRFSPRIVTYDIKDHSPTAIPPQPHNIPLILFLSVFYQTVKPVKENFKIKNKNQQSTSCTRILGYMVDIEPTLVAGVGPSQ